MRARLETGTTSGGMLVRARLKRERGFPYVWHFHREYELTLIVRDRDP